MRILLGGAADVPAFRVQDHRDIRRDLVDVLDQPLELVLGALGREIGDLRLERDHQILGGVDDGRAKVEDARRVALPGARELGGVRIQADAEHRVVQRLGAAKLGDETPGSAHPRHRIRCASCAAWPV